MMRFDARIIRTKTEEATIQIHAENEEAAFAILSSACNCLNAGMSVENDGPLEWKHKNWSHGYVIDKKKYDLS